MSHRKLLAANFFFTRDEEELSSTTKFFTTLTFQLAEFNPHLRSAIIDKLDHNPDIVHPNQGLRRHWKELIMDPLLSISENDSWREPYVIVIDALDECYDESAVELMIELLGETSSLEGRRLKVFITSRPETHIRYALDDDTDSHKVTVLDKISKDIVDQDIRYYLREQFKLIQRKKRTLLPIHWPGNDSIEQLVRLSDGLFIYAATVCRYIETTKRHPNENLEVTLQSKSPIKGEASGTQNLDTMYLTVLRMALKRSENLQYATTFKKVLGTVLVLAEPVNLEQLSFLCGIEDWRVHGILDFLPAVVGVSSMHDPIRILHKSFGDFLTKKERCMDSNFWIDETVSTYALIALSFSKMSETLVAPDICDLKHPATAANKIDCQVIERSFPTAIQYICRYWAHHLQQCKSLYNGALDARLINNLLCIDLSLVSPKILRHMLYKRTLKFFQTCFLGWLEAFSLMGKIPDVIAMLQDLQPSLLVCGHNS